MPAVFSQDLTVTHYNLETAKGIAMPVTLALVADLHSRLFTAKGKKVSEVIAKENPDVLLLAGDIADSGRSYLPAARFIQEVSQICPVFYASGNHEARSRRYADILPAFAESGATVLTGNWKKIVLPQGEFLIAGIEDLAAPHFRTRGRWRRQLLAFEGLRNRPEYKILLSHRPEFPALYAQTPFDLVVSGHAHGGQVRIPKLVPGLFSPGQGLFPKRAGGVYPCGEGVHAVSRGISYDPHLPRVCNPPELVMLHIYPAK